MGKSNQELKTWLNAVPMSSDYTSPTFDSRDVGSNLGNLQVTWSGFNAVNGIFKVQVSGTGDANSWNDAGGEEVECAVDNSADSQMFAVNIAAFPFFRLVFLHGAGTTGTFTASYFFRGTI